MEESPVLTQELGKKMLAKRMSRSSVRGAAARTDSFFSSVR
jgi:hypothetical protein